MSYTILIPKYIIDDESFSDYKELTVEKEINGVKFLFKKFREYDNNINHSNVMKIKNNNDYKEYPLNNISGHILYKFGEKNMKTSLLIIFI